MLADKMSTIEALGILLDLAEDNILQEDQTNGCPELKDQRKLQVTAINIVDTLRMDMKRKEEKSRGNKIRRKN